MKSTRFITTGCLLVLFTVLSLVPSSFAYAPNSSSNPITVLAKNQNSHEIQLNGSYVYWNNNETQIRRVSETGGAVQTIFSAAEISSFAISGNYLYWGSQDSLDKTELSTLKTTVLCTQNTSEYCFFPYSILVTGNYVFFASLLGAIIRINTNGSGLRVISPSNLHVCVSGMTLSAGYLYWNNCTGQVGKVAISGKNAHYISPNICAEECTSVFYFGIHSITVANSSVYWTYNVYYQNNSYFQLVNSVSTTGKHFTTLFKGKGSSGFLSTIAYYSGSVIFPYESSSGGKIYSVPASGGKATVIAKTFAIDSEVSGNYLYFSTGPEIAKVEV